MDFTPITLAAQLTSISFKDAITIAVLGFILVIMVLAILALFVKFLSFVVGSAVKKETKKDVSPIEESKPLIKTPTEAPTGILTLDGVSEQDAAVIMAITSNKTGIPLERLSFNSIKRLNRDPELVGISEQDAAVVMAITSDKTGIPLEKLEFKSIKLTED